MPTFEVRLESQENQQARIVSLDAPDEIAARAECEAQEVGLANFSLLPPEKDVWENPPGGPESADGVVDLSRYDAYDPAFAKHTATLSYKDAVKAAEERLSGLESAVLFDRKGKVQGTSLGRRAIARLAAHKQQEPYAVVDVRKVEQQEIDAQRLVDFAVALKENHPAGWQHTLDLLRKAGVPMNAVTAFLYGVPWQKQIDGSAVTVFSSATVKMSLHTGLTAVQDTDDFFNDVSASEITGTGYTAGGFTFANKTSAYDTATDQIRLDNTVDPNWTTSTLSATDSIVTNTSPGTSATNPVYGNVDFGATVTTTAGTFTITLDATGWAVFDVT